MTVYVNRVEGESSGRHVTRVITEKLARKRFNELLDSEHALGDRRPKGRSLYQVVCRGEQWVGLVLWTGAIWHIRARDAHLAWDSVTRSGPRKCGSKPCIPPVPTKDAPLTLE
jgi:hypothetical protein